MNTTVRANPKGIPPNNLERELLQEERLVAELELLGIRYLSRLTGYRARRVRQPQRLLADLIRQPNSRVRVAFISLLLSYPAYARFIPEVLRNLALAEQWTLKYYYTAAVFLQKKYAHKLEPFLTDRWSWLPDWFSADLGIPGQLSFDEQLRTLGRQHRQQTGIILNWTGTYENAAKHLIHRWELEKKGTSKRCSITNFFTTPGGALCQTGYNLSVGRKRTVPARESPRDSRCGLHH